MSERERLRATFDEVAELYQRARPGDPTQLFDDLRDLARLRAGAAILEVGSGTGQGDASSSGAAIASRASS